MWLLAASLLILAFGPLFYRLLESRRETLSLLDGFNLVAIAGLIFLSVLPEAIAEGGLVTLIFVAVGMLGPTLLEHHFHRIGREAHVAALILGIIGICVHAAIDGAALLEGIASGHAEPVESLGSRHAHVHLPVAVVLHRLPVSLTLWMLLRPKYGPGLALGTLIAVACSTVGGFALGPWLETGLSGQGMACFQALVAGTLMHVIIHRTPDRDPRFGCGLTARSRLGWYAGIGGAAGIVLLVILLGEDALLHGEALDSPIGEQFVALALESAPALLLGYVLAGLLGAFLPASSIRWVRRGRSWSQALRGLVVGLPMPVCSCGVVPLYRTLVQRGAPASAAMAFLVATPELGVDAVLLSIPLLGVEMTVLRVVCAALVALVVGWLVGGFASGQPNEPGADDLPAAPRGSVAARLRQALRIGLCEVVDHTGPWILLGLAVAAVAAPLLESTGLTSLSPWLMVPLFALLGVPTYVCAAGATPLVAVLLVEGVSPGAAIAFLLTGPATNVTTFGLVGRLHGRTVALAFSLTIVGLSILLGYLTDGFFPGAAAGATAASPHGDVEALLKWLCVAALGGLYFFSFLRRGPRRFLGELFFEESVTSEPTTPDDADSHHHAHGHSH